MAVCEGEPMIQNCLWTLIYSSSFLEFQFSRYWLLKYNWQGEPVEFSDNAEGDYVR